MKTQGDNILHALDYMKRKKGSEGLAALSKKLDFKVNDIKSESWYPFELYIQVMDQIGSHVVKSGYSIPSRIGYNRAQKVGFLQNCTEVSDPVWVLEKIKHNWRRYYDFGRIEVVRNSEKDLEFHLHDYESHPIFCERMNGFLKGLLREVCQIKDAAIEETECKNNGGAGCRFQIRW